MRSSHKARCQPGTLSEPELLGLASCEFGGLGIRVEGLRFIVPGQKRVYGKGFQPYRSTVEHKILTSDRMGPYFVSALARYKSTYTIVNAPVSFLTRMTCTIWLSAQGFRKDRSKRGPPQNPNKHKPCTPRKKNNPKP